MASEAELDGSSGGKLLLGETNTELQNTWGAVAKNMRTPKS